MVVHCQVGKIKALITFYPLHKTTLIVTVRNFFGHNIFECYSFGAKLDTVSAKQVPTRT